MYPLVAFGEYGVSAQQLLWGLSLYLVISAIALTLGPRLAVPHPPYDETLATTGTVIELRSKVRQSILQFLGGVAVISTFILAIQQIRQGEDTFKEKKATLFSKSLSTLFEATSQPSARIEAMYTLSYLSRSDPSYHRAVFDALANYVRARSPSICDQTNGKIVESSRRDSQIQTAMRIIGERDPAHDPTGKRFNIEHACLTDIDMRDEKSVITGLRNARLSNAIILRSDFTNADLTHAEFMGAWAADYYNADWKLAEGFKLYPASDGDPRIGQEFVNSDRRRQLVANFVGANLFEANFEGARLAGADFSWANLERATFRYANIARANFANATNLTPEQFREACVGRPDHPDELDAQQPFFSDKDRKAIGKVRLCY